MRCMVECFFLSSTTITYVVCCGPIEFSYLVIISPHRTMKYEPSKIWVAKQWTALVYILAFQINGEAIYETVPWKFQNDTAAKDVWYTATRVCQYFL